MMFASDHNDVILEQLLDDDTFLWRRRRIHAAKKQIDTTLLQVAILRCCEKGLGHIDHDTWVPSETF
jgi:hypothetical protein